ncbi:iron complex outermembrane receptor protein [Sphingobium sp. OAS761]|uniref:TonB-dependent receptor n=1 Tax=Sphingobium sp. OAS761 TaxID=2817901 RepID=UPI00209EB645|nr:TonB-dependent receptor plug domain-containing protein [Sphingobium sp. OAS761]MCP1470344.1 iron complex outermembrane receptor protein [Sphingobium sp. OAS761]
MRRIKFSATATSLFGLTAGLLLTAQPGTALAQAAAADQPAQGIADIIVTANRREEGMQKVATAVSALNADTLREQNISSASDLMGRIPSLNVTTNGQQREAETITIRGQGQTYLAPTGVVNYFAEVPLIAGSIIGNQGGPGTLFDVESLQVLRGPQGTLFGKNTTGGALLIGPKKPTDRLEGWVSAQLGNYNSREFEAVVNIPIVEDKLAVRFSFKKADRDGYTIDAGTADLPVSLPFQGAGFTPVVIKNSGLVLPGNGPNSGNLGLPGINNTHADFRGKDYDDRHYWVGRVGVLFKPTETIENYLVVHYAKSHNNGTGQILYAVATDHPTLTNLVANTYGNANLGQPGAPGAFTSGDSTIAEALAARSRALGPRRTSLNQDQFYELETYSIVDTLNVQLSDELTFRNIFGYQRMKQDYSWDLDGSPLPILSQVPNVVSSAVAARFPELEAGMRAKVTNTSLLTVEPQIQADLLDGKLTGVVGLFYSKQKPEGLQATGSYNAAGYGGGYFWVTTKSKAVYGQATLDFGAFSPSLDGLKFTGGIRYTNDQYDGRRISPNYVVIPLASAGDTYKKTTWTLGVDYQMRNALLYAKITKGYKAGGFNYAGVRPDGLTFDPEYVKSYEIGAKTDFTLGSIPMRVNLSGYRLDYDGIQRAAGDNFPNGCPDATNPYCNTTGLDQGAITYNAGTARVHGIELETTARLFPGFELSGSYSYTKGRYLDYKLTLPPDPPAGSSNAVRQTCSGPVTVPKGIGVPGAVLDFSCAPFPFIPKNQFAINARYSHELENGLGTLVLSGSYSHADKNWTAVTTLPSQEPGGYVDAYNLFNASVDWNGVGGSGVDLRFFVTNLTNTTFKVSNTASSLDSSTGFNDVVYNEPRMVGAQIRYRFGSN